MMNKIIVTMLALTLSVPAFAQVPQDNKISPPRHQKEQVESVEQVLQRLAAFKLFTSWCSNEDGSFVEFSEEEIAKFMQNVATQLKSSGKELKELEPIFRDQLALERERQQQFVIQHNLPQEAWCALQQKVWTANGYGALFEEKKD